MVTPHFVAVAAAACMVSRLGQVAAFVTAIGDTRQQAVPSRAGLSLFLPPSSCSRTSIAWATNTCRYSSSPYSGSFGFCNEHQAASVRRRRRHWSGRPVERRRNASVRQLAHKDVPLDEGQYPQLKTTEARGSDNAGDEIELSLLDELLARGEEATKSGGATESSHTGSSEWAGFKTAPHLLEAVRQVLGRARMRSRHSDGSAMAWSWLTLSPRPVRVAVATPESGRLAVYLTVLPAGNGSPPSHRPMYGCHILSRVIAGEVEQVKSNSQRVIGRSTHSLETPVWSSFGGGARRLINESFNPAVILEVVLYDWSRGSGYSGSYAAPGTSNSGSAENRAEAEGIGVAETMRRNGGEGGEGEGPARGVLPIVEMGACPCPPALLFRDGDLYDEEEEEEEEGGAGGGLTLVRSDGVVEQGRVGGAGSGGGEGGGGAVGDLFTADDLACDVGGLDGQLEDIVRRVLSTRSIPTELRQALGVSHVRGLLLHGPPGCGKTLLARELSRRLGARPPKLVSGPEILDKWVGEAERKVRLLFLDAELDHERCVQMGEDPASLPLHLICFDEIDALCRRRGSLSGDTSGVRDSVVNQILSKMDGLVNLENVLVVGMTNRKELLDDALLRPGRMEVCMPIPLPDAGGREQILAIHLRRAREAGLVSPEVDDASLAKQTEGFSGADLAGLVRSATSFAIADWRRRYEGEEGDEGSDGEYAGVLDQEQQSTGRTSVGAVNGGSENGTAERSSSSVGSGDSISGGDARTSSDGKPAVEITVKNFEQALREVDASGRSGRVGMLRRIRALRRL